MLSLSVSPARANLEWLNGDAWDMRKVFSVGICRLRRFDVVRRMISDNAWFSEAMTQEDMAREHRNPSRHRIEEHDVLNWLEEGESVSMKVILRARYHRARSVWIL